jgi:hypothetical protein
VPAPALMLRRASASRKGGHWQHEDYDVFDGDSDVGRIYLVDGYGGRETWFWGVSFQVTKRKSYGYADSIEEAKAAVRAEDQGGLPGRRSRRPSGPKIKAAFRAEDVAWKAEHR